MHNVRSIRRLALGAAIAGAAIGAVPTVASAATTCTYSATRNVSITDGSGTLPLRLFLSEADFIGVTEGVNGTPIFCGGANVTNTEQINISGPILTNVDGYVVDASTGDFGPGFTKETGFSESSEVEIKAFPTGGPRASLKVIGSARPETMNVGANGLVNLGIDQDADIAIGGGASFVRLDGGAGQDLLAGDGFGGLGHSTVRLFLNGGAGADQLIGGDATDDFTGGSEGDVFHALGGANDVINGGSGFDVANADKIDRFTDVVESRNIDPIGRLRLAPAVLKAEAAKTARLTMSWQHPKAWRELRKVELSVYRGKEAVGMINARPASERLTDMGAIELMEGSKLGHHGKWVTAKLALRLPKSLAGEDLRVDVRATDRDGQRQLERNAGSIRVAK